jgi:hypothetical protein
LRSRYENDLATCSYFARPNNIIGAENAVSGGLATFIAAVAFDLDAATWIDRAAGPIATGTTKRSLR